MRLNKDWKFKESFPTFSAYVTSYNCIKNGYPILEAIKSFSWCDEVVVVDGGSDDSTKQEIEKLELDNVVIYDLPIDWDNPGKDGQQKAMARAMCMKDILIQFDADEICLGDPYQWKKIAKAMTADIVELPVLEPFGDISSLRLNKEHNPLKWRITKNNPEITHGIPRGDQLKKDDRTFSRGGSDGCNFIHIVNEHPFPSVKTDVSSEFLSLFRRASDDPEGYISFVEGMIMQNYPLVLHVGHVDLEQKIRLFLNEWRKWWAHLYDRDPEDVSMYFSDKKLDDITNEDIKNRAKELTKEIPTVKIEILKEVFENEEGSSL